MMQKMICFNPPGEDFAAWFADKVRLSQLFTKNEFEKVCICKHLDKQHILFQFCDSMSRVNISAIG